MTVHMAPHNITLSCYQFFRFTTCYRWFWAPTQRHHRTFSLKTIITLPCCPRFYFKKKNREYTHHVILYYGVHLSICSLSCGLYNTCSHRHNTTKHITSQMHRVNFDRLIKWTKISLSTEMLKNTSHSRLLPVSVCTFYPQLLYYFTY